MKIFPDWSVKIWNAWDIKVMVLWSIILQIILIFFGSRRKYTRGILLNGVVWAGYLMADWIAIVALGKLSDIASAGQGGGDDESQHEEQLMALWAPLLLLHLGGADTITAYSVEDIQLWLRHLLALAAHLTVAIYVFLRCWAASWLSVLTFPMFMAGIIKYGERIWVLSSVNRDDVETNFPAMDSTQVLDFISRVNVPAVRFPLMGYFCSKFLTPYLDNYIHMNNVNFVANYMFQIFENHQTVFKISEFALGFVYDVLYTKAAIIYSGVGCFLRFVSFTSTLVVLVGFSAISKTQFSSIDIFITYLLLIGAVVLEVYAFVRMIFSDWMLIRMVNRIQINTNTRLDTDSKKNWSAQIMTYAMRGLVPWTLSKRRRRWSNAVAQFNLLSFCLYKENQNLMDRLLKLFGLDMEFKKYQCEKHEVGDQELEHTKELVFGVVKRSVLELGEGQIFGTHLKGRMTFRRYGCAEDFRWLKIKDFDEILLCWHIVTNICYYNHHKSGGITNKEMESSMYLSNYMIYLLDRFPYMWPVTSGKIKIKEISDTGIPLVIKNHSARDEAEICSTMREIHRVLGTEEAHGILQHAVKMAGIFLEDKFRDSLWKITSEVWAEMLCLQAAYSNVSYHILQLRRGGELITHVWFALSLAGFANKVRLRGDDLRRHSKEVFASPERTEDPQLAAGSGS